MTVRNRPLIENGIVVNLVRLADDAEWTPQSGQTLGPDGGAIGDSWDGAVYTPAQPAGVLADIKSTLLNRIDADAERERGSYLTSGSGMAMVYLEKFAQAQAVAAIGQAAADAMTQSDRESQFPTLSASIGIEAASLWDCAHLVLEKYAQFAALSLYIERARLAGKAAVKAATTIEGVRAAYAAVAWPTP